MVKKWKSEKLFFKICPNKGTQLVNQKIIMLEFSGNIGSWSLLEKSDPHNFDPLASPGAPLNHLMVPS